MASLIANAAAGFEPIQGYVLRDKLGAGGYGEVWLADAPGGLKKAIKFIFGSLDESRANSELKALQRIRQVTHPFLLSLERIEIVDGQLIIVTELADGSLTDRFKKFRDDGYVGIPREQLLDYLRDAADALDFLCQKHDLQHLDVKPANMLLVADRVKVADFGLVKDIQSQSMSMLGGMTPTYAAPEMFDGRPGRFSDQYSLAIVYQELLTGTLPFNGRTTAQLASEHLHRAPNLDPVPPGDRPVLAKALAKKASQRFASCREFIDRLIAVNKPQVSAAVASPVEPARARNTPPKADAKPSDPKTSQVQIETGTQVFQEREVINLSELPPTPNSVDTTSPICFIGLGCTGAEVLTGLRQELHRNHIDYSTHPEWTWLLLDTDARCIEAATNEATQGAMSVDATLHLALKPSQYYRECDEASFAPLSRRWLYNVPRSRMTEGVRPLGMLALLDHAESVHRAIQNYIAHLQAIGEEKGWDGQNPIRIYLVASAHGGTGSAWIAEIGFLVRRELEERGLNGMIQAVLTIAEAKDQVTTDIRSACAVTCLNEIAHYVNSGGLHPGLPSIPPSQAVSKAPLDDLYLVHGGMLGDRSGWETAIDQAIEYLFLDGCTSVGRSLDVARHQTHATADTQTDCDWTSWLRTLCSQRIDIGSRLSPRYLASMTTLQAAQRWLVRFRNNQIDMHSEPLDNVPANVATQRKKVLEQIDFLVSDLFRDKRWTAQAWLSRCMNLLMQDQHVPIEPSIQERNTSPLLDEEVLVEIERISDRLVVDIDQCRHDAGGLLEETLRDFEDWLEKRWIPNQSCWGLFNTMLTLVVRRFQEQGSSLRNVSHRLRLQHDTILERIHSAEVQESLGNVDAELAELDRLEVQARIHDIAGLMLVRLSHYFESFSNRWKAELNLHLREFGNFCIPLAESLDVAVTSQGILREPIMPLPSDWEAVRVQLDRSIEAQLCNWITGDLKERWHNPDSSPTTSSWTSPNSDSGWNRPSTTVGSASSTTSRPLTVATKAREATLLTELLAECQQTAIQLCTEHGLSWENEDAASDGKMARGTSIAKQVRESSPPFLKWGGAKRNLLILPANLSEELDTRWKSIFTEPISILRLSSIESPLFLADGEQIILQEILMRLYRNTTDKQNLVSRLESRSDVDWLPVTMV